MQDVKLVLAQQHNYIAAAIISNTPTTGINKTTSTVKGYHDRSIPTYITGEYYDKLNTEVTSKTCYENSRITTFYNCEDYKLMHLP
jgi:replication-associated recombination protein RarA